MQTYNPQISNNYIIQPLTKHHVANSVPNKSEKVSKIFSDFKTFFNVCKAKNRESRFKRGLIPTRLIKHQNFRAILMQPLNIKNKMSTHVEINKTAGLRHAGKKKTLTKPLLWIRHKNLLKLQQASKKLNLLLQHSLTAYSILMAIQWDNHYSLKTQNLNMVGEANTVFSGLTIAGLSAVKKLLLNRVYAVDNVLVPGYNRRSHSTSHTNSVTYQHRKVSKTFGYIASKALRFWISLALAACYGTSTVTGKVDFLKPQNGSFALHTKYKSQVNSGLSFKGLINESVRVNLYQKPTILLVNIIETRAAVLLWRTQMCKSVFHAKQVINHQGFKWTKPNCSLDSIHSGLNQYHKHRSSNKSAKQIRTDLNDKSSQNILYSVTRYSNWVDCGSALRLLHPLVAIKK